MIIEKKPMATEMRAPLRTIVKTSRPLLSVPKKWLAAGPVPPGIGEPGMSSGL